GTVMGLCGIARNITERKRFEEALRDKERQLEMQAKNLEEVNTALKVLLDHREEEKRKMQEDIVSKARKLLFPYMEKLERSGIDDDGKIFLSIIRSNLQELISSNVSASGRQYRHLTPMEIQVADLIKQGKTSKEMASMLNISEHAISFHRSNIRKKLGLLHTKTNLGVYLLSDEPA
ncbi:MAG TPA: LuxR C-terminal-related transcriptional regulator, partial [Deltaproteobacteria bacterium]|nr:LuxR C-terminal-related transcriptional regulator [Deltaproteobacteria bacterium]